MRKLMTMIAAVACLALWAGSVARADDDKLVVVQDESSMERKIESYLKDKHQLTINEKFATPDDLYLELPFKESEIPAFRVLIDTEPLNKDANGQINERGIRVQLFTGIKVPADKWADVIRIVNDFNRRKTFCSACVDNVTYGGEIVMDWTLNVLPDGLATEYVYDALARETAIWKAMYPDVAAALK